MEFQFNTSKHGNLNFMSWNYNWTIEFQNQLLDTQNEFRILILQIPIFLSTYKTLATITINHSLKKRKKNQNTTKS